MKIKDYIANSIKGKSFRFKCDCIIKMDVVGKIVDYEIINNEILFIVNSSGKIIKIGENHPNLEIYEV